MQAEPRLLSSREVLEQIPVSRTTLWRMIRDRFPAPQHIRGRVFWNSEIVAQFITRGVH